MAAVADILIDGDGHCLGGNLRTRLPGRGFQSRNLEPRHRGPICHLPNRRTGVTDRGKVPQTTEAIMRSIYEQALGDRFKLLHPRIQERFGFCSKDRCASIGKGIMDNIWRGKFFTLPFLYIGSWRRIMFPERGTTVPFTIWNYAYIDPFGRETVTWIRSFETRHPRRFDAYMIYSKERGCIVDYLGTHQHLAVDIHLSVDDRGGLRLRSGAQRFYEGLIAFNFPLTFSGIADVCEWYDDGDDKFHIEVNVHNDVWGPLFGYSGSFNAESVKLDDPIPTDLVPKRYERRE